MSKILAQEGKDGKDIQSGSGCEKILFFSHPLPVLSAHIVAVAHGGKRNVEDGERSRFSLSPSFFEQRYPITLAQVKQGWGKIRWKADRQRLLLEQQESRRRKQQAQKQKNQARSADREITCPRQTVASLLPASIESPKKGQEQKPLRPAPKAPTPAVPP